MLDINVVRAEFAAHLAQHAGTRYSLDAAMMHVVEQAYRKGLEDGRHSMQAHGAGQPFTVVSE